MSCFPNQYMTLIEIDEMYILTRVNSEHLNFSDILFYLFITVFMIAQFCAIKDKIW